MVKNVIHLEDDDDDIEVFKDVVALQPSSISYVNLKSHDEALKLLLNSNLTTDLIVINYLMVGSNAENFIRELKQNSGFTNIPIIILSSSYAPNEVGRLLKAGAISYFQKPAGYRKYAEIIEHILTLPKGIYIDGQA